MVGSSLRPDLLCSTEPVNSLPILRDLPSLVLAREGSSVELPCIASAYPLPVYNWFKNGLPVPVVEGSLVSQRGGNLMIRKAQLRDAGTYMCTAENSLGHHSASIVMEITG